ncbi:Hypothetical_protein [Hexamita inflata]|uniref:Hypothetical_protein n=1 Tax=Hexamita inflata TaxID=28002 RepID=A0AA86URD9_9EUKA|nr:Hypothetical protein HINF_LOCUS49246 [Hexamita inflata]
MQNSLLQQMTQLNSNTLNYASSTYLKLTDFNSRTQQLTQNLQSYSQTQATNALNNANQYSFNLYQNTLKDFKNKFTSKQDAIYVVCNPKVVCNIYSDQDCHSGGGSREQICSALQWNTLYFKVVGGKCVCTK